MPCLNDGCASTSVPEALRYHEGRHQWFGKVGIAISDNCKPFAPGLASKRVPCKSLKRDPADEHAEKFYTLFDLDVAAAENVKLVTESLLEEVFVGSPVILRAPSGGPSEGPAAEFIKTLKECINVLCR